MKHRYRWTCPKCQMTGTLEMTPEEARGSAPLPHEAQKFRARWVGLARAAETAHLLAAGQRCKVDIPDTDDEGTMTPIPAMGDDDGKEHVDKLLTQLNAIARAYDKYEFGLPIGMDGGWDDKMRAAVVEWMVETLKGWMKEGGHPKKHAPKCQQPL